MNFNYKNITSNSSFGSNDLFSGQNNQTGRGLTGSEEALFDKINNPLNFKLASEKEKKKYLEEQYLKAQKQNKRENFFAGRIGQRLNVIA